MILTDKINIFNQDCIEVMQCYPDQHFDLAIVDPPYGIGQYWMKQKHTYHYGKNDWNEGVPDAKYFKELFRVSKNQIVFGGNYFTEHLPTTNSWIFWDKGNSVKKMNTSEGELAWTSFKIPMRKVFVQWSGGRKGNETGKKNIHPCQRPIDLHKWILNNYTNEGDKILDTHGGSMSTVIACESAGLEIVCCEKDPEYFNLAKERIENHLSQLQINF